MCLGIPMQITHIDHLNATCAARGVERTVSLFLLQHESLSVGDHVIVHVGYAIQKMTETEARSSWALLDEMLDQETAGSPSS
ncbi:MAG: HypC/HybG/HupF family hydrogenase formation chaperone [Magnetococcales bacterium]|nr:HypC/HybG/HupF family hydrogenase formation chaperone [Magnetococcales bacterium]